MTNGETSRPTTREDKTKAETPEAPDFSKFNVNNSYQVPAMGSGSGLDNTEKRRLSARQLRELDISLSCRDKEVLAAVQKYRYLMSGQIQRLCFTEAASPQAGLRAANRCLKKLKEMGLLDSLSRRIGGVRAGSASFVWFTSHAGERLLRLHDSARSTVRRSFEPSPYFLSHTLAAAEAGIRLTEISKKNGIQLSSMQIEPECWREYSEYGARLSLKPDLYAATISGEYEDRYFLEIDLDTESPAKVIEKCGRYHKYYQSGTEQEESGVFPLTVWIVPNARRKQRLIESIKSAFDKQPRLFAVIVPDELEHLIRDGGDSGMLC